MVEVRKSLINSYISKGQRYTYHRPSGKRLPDLPLDDPRLMEAIQEIERTTEIKSGAAETWGGRVHIPPREDGLARMETPVAPDVVAFSVPQIIRFIFRARQGSVIYYHHGNLLDDARRDPNTRHNGRYISTCISLGLLAPRQERAFDTETHYFAVRTSESAAAPGMPRNTLDGTITPDEYEALRAIDERQASISTSRAIRDALGISDDQASQMRNDFINRGWLTHERLPAPTALGVSMMA